MKHYQHILFDLDHTLWDFEKNSTETLHELYASFRLADLETFTAEQFCDTFQEVNRWLWKLYNRGEYDQARLRSERFPLILTQLGVAESMVPVELADAYLRMCPTKPHIFPHTREVLEYLQTRYTLHILTNGFAEVQAIKLKSAGLSDYFTQVVSSDDAGYKKPHRGIFDFALDCIGASCSECIMIGDNLEADIRGAQGVGMDHIYFNPYQVAHSETVMHEVNCLSDLRKIL